MNTRFRIRNVALVLVGVAGLLSKSWFRDSIGSLAYATPLFVLDGIPISDDPLSIIQSIPMSIIDKVEVLKGGGGAIYGSRGAHGVIAVYTRRGETPKAQELELVGAITKKVVGFSPRREFYSPKYTPQTRDNPAPDHRTTLYWNPEITIENGKATVSFSTADDPGYYRIIVEGISEDGKICFGTARFMVDINQEAEK